MGLSSIAIITLANASRIVAGPADGQDGHQAPGLCGAEVPTTPEQKIKRQSRQPGEDVRHQFGRDERQGRGHGQNCGQADQHPRPTAEPMHPQHQAQGPDAQGALKNRHRPEIRETAGTQQQAIDGRAAGHHDVGERRLQIAAAVIEQKGKAVDRRRQHQQRGGDDTRGRHDERAGSGHHGGCIE